VRPCGVTAAELWNSSVSSVLISGQRHEPLGTAEVPADMRSSLTNNRATDGAAMGYGRVPSKGDLFVPNDPTSGLATMAAIEAFEFRDQMVGFVCEMCASRTLLRTDCGPRSVIVP
jgi:hypothetical protein